ncbi:MAG TPA: flavodoxin [Candidatus Pelethocola excrementipullorum]|nr:flavodoxin [Candidatus Pelethocola excrementipullorum]
MSKIVVAYWSGTGNTEMMAESIAEGIKEAGQEAEVVSMDNFNASDLKDCSAFALGCPAMGAEELEDSIVEPFVDEVVGFASGKKIGLFGSYDWGDGEWMRLWEQQMKDAGAEIVGGEGVICNNEPDDEAKENCRKLGADLAVV